MRPWSSHEESPFSCGVLPLRAVNYPGQVHMHEKHEVPDNGEDDTAGLVSGSALNITFFLI